LQVNVAPAGPSGRDRAGAGEDVIPSVDRGRRAARATRAPDRPDVRDRFAGCDVIEEGRGMNVRALFVPTGGTTHPGGSMSHPQIVCLERRLRIRGVETFRLDAAWAIESRGSLRGGRQISLR